MPKISIITINFNNLNGLNQTIQSVITQSYKDFEYIIIDGGSCDGSKEIIEKYTKDISYWVSENDTGIYHAMNKGIAQAKGEYLLFLNSGDFFLNDEVLRKVFSDNPWKDILYGEIIFESGIENKILMKLPEDLTLEYLFESTIWHPSTFIKKVLFEKNGNYNQKYKIAADYDFFFRAIIVKKCSTQYMPFPITVFNTEGISSDSKNLNKIQQERESVHLEYLSSVDIVYLNNYKKIRNKTLSKWIVGRPVASFVVNYLCAVYITVKFFLRPIYAFLKRVVFGLSRH